METIHHRRINKKFRGFTLVELIVVITILVILGTIGFMSISGYSLSARDSTRISDMVNIKKSLELTSIKTSSYPTPTGGSGVTFSGGIVWTQGTIGDSVVTQVNAAGFRLSKKPMDPKYTSVEYTYSLLNNGKEYQVATTMEDSSTALNYPIITPVYAADPLTAYIGGNYNGLIAKVSTGTTTVTTYYLTLPSIVLQDLSSTELTNQNTQSGNLVLHKKGNIPSSYRGSGIVPSSPGITFDGLKNSNLLSSGTGIVAYSTTGSLGSSGVTVMMSNLYNLYNGSNLKGDNVSAGSVSSLMSGGSGSTVLVNMYNGSLGKSLGGGVVDSGGGGGGGSALVNGACTGLLSTGAIYYNSGTSYNLSNAPIGTSLVASYTGGMISSNTCQFNCSSAYSWSGATSSCILRGEVVYATGGTYNWTVPAGVTSVSVVCVGGGANGGGVGGGGGGSLVYQNNIIVTSGQAFNFTVGAGGTSSAPLGQDSWIGGTAQAQGGRPGNMSGGVGGQYLGGNGGGNGGNGKFGGGGAGGYAGNGGNAATGDYGSGLSGSRGGGGGGGGSSGANFGGGGGGVGLLGEGVSGDGGGSGGAHGGKGGSGGENGNLSGGQNGGKYGGGGGWGAGGDGACRIIWPGTTRTFPSTDVGP